MSDDQITEEIIALYNRTYAEVRRRSYLLYERARITVPQLTALQMLKENGPLAVTELAEKLYLNQSTVSSLVERLERDGWLQREKGADRRKTILSLTAKGNKVTQNVPVRPMAIFRSLFDPLTKEEKQELLRMMQKISAPLFARMEAMERDLGSGAKGGAAQRTS